MRQVLFGLFMIFTISASAQSDLMLYNFDATGQSLHLNPATPQQSNVWVGLPVVSGVMVNYHNNSFSLYDVFNPESNINDDLARVTGDLSERSLLTVNQQSDLLGVGFKVGKGYVSLGATQQLDFRMSLPNDLFRIIVGDGATVTDFSLSSFGLESVVRTNYYLGYQHKLLDDKLTIGGRFKYIYGQGHAYLERTELSVRNESRYEMVLETDILGRSSGIGFANTFDDPGALIFSENTGTAVDLGLNYQATDRISFSASVIDWGGITWKENTQKFSSKGEYTYEGIEVDYSEGNWNESYQNTQDSLEAALQVETDSGESYHKRLMSRIFVGFNYKLSERHTLGALYHTRRWNGRLYHDIGVNYQGRLSRTFQITAGYSIINGTYSNLGLGFSLKLGAFQLYALSDNIFTAFDYTGVKNANARVGINLAFYGKRQKKKDEQEEKVKESEEPGVSLL